MGKLPVPGAAEPALLARRAPPEEAPAPPPPPAPAPPPPPPHRRPPGPRPPAPPAPPAEPPLAKHERPGRADALGPLALVDRVRVGDQAVAAHAAPGAVDGGEERQIEASALPAVAGHQALAADVEGPEHVARPLLADDLPRTVEGQHAEPAAAGSAVGGDEREAVVAPLDLRLGEPQVGGEHHHPHALVAGEVVEVQVEGGHRELAAALRARAVEDEREEREAARPLGCRRCLLRRGRGPGAGAVGEEEQAEGLVVLLPARRGERVEDVGAVVVPGAAPLVQAEEGTEEEVAALGRAPELDQGAEGRPAHVARGLVARVAHERPQLDVERRGAGGEGERQRDRRAAGAPPASGRTQLTSRRAPGAGTHRPASARRRWSSCAG